MNQEPIFIALSGGVDSAAAAYLLKEKYSNLIGISHIVWPESKCCSKICLDRAALMCRQIGIPYHRIVCISEFTQKVVEPFINTYLAGETPNPCVLCNEKIRFFYMIEEYFRKQGHKPDDYKIATGHYARIEEKDNRFYLKRGKDKTKDQSYMLYRLSQEQLAHCIFPLGDYTKKQVREFAAKFGIEAAWVKDSQDICFIENDYAEFIEKYIQKKMPEGNFLNKEGVVLGRHKGIHHYTRGQRKGLGLHGGPWYVLSIDTKSNNIILGIKQDLEIKNFNVRNLSWIYPDFPKKIKRMVQTRYHSLSKACEITPLNQDEIQVELESPSVDVSPGQSAVFYDGEYVIGGGEIQLRIKN